MILKQLFKITFLVIVQLNIISVCKAQVIDGMLIFQVDENRYIRKNYDGNKNLKNYQTIEIGKTEVSDNRIETKMTVITYEADGTLKDASQTSLVCTPESQQVLMGIFPFAGEKSKRSLVVKMEDGAILYPTGWRELTELKDFNFNLNFEGGAAGFFGTKSDISITDRKVMPLKDVFGVSGKMTLKAYIFGIKISTIQYDFFEKIDKEKGIISQKFTEANGDFFTIEIEK